MKFWAGLVVVFIVLILFFLFAIWHPKSQIFGKVIYNVNSDRVLLTFDDGPGEYTNEILDILKENDIKAIFFLIGNKAKENPELVKRIVNEGHVIGVHSLTHPFLFKNNYKEIVDTKIILQNISNTKVKYFRPPYGFRLPKTLSVSKNANLTTMTWDVFPRDYKRNAHQILNNVLKTIKKGSIICLHDGVLNSNETVEALPKIIDDLRDRDFEFVNPRFLKFN